MYVCVLFGWYGVVTLLRMGHMDDRTGPGLCKEALSTEVGMLIERDKGFAKKHPESNHAPTIRWMIERVRVQS